MCYWRGLFLFVLFQVKCASRREMHNTERAHVGTLKKAYICVPPACRDVELTRTQLLPEIANQF